MPLRRLLPLLTVALVALALLVAGVLATTALRGYLVHQVDRDLLRSPTASGVPPPPADVAQNILPSSQVLEIIDDSGTTVRRFSNLPTGVTEPTLPRLTRAEVLATAQRPFTVDGWRVIALPAQNGTSTLVALPLADVEATVSRLIWLQVGVGLITLAAVGALSTVVVRRSLRPLAAVERTAVAISGGELHDRVPEPAAGTEAGDVGLALNSMLDRLELSFEQRQQALDVAQASEARMRQFVADASHELRTPLTGVRGTAELYRQGAIPVTEVPAAFGRIEQESQRMGALVDELLLLARLDAQRPLAHDDVDLLQVCSESARSLGAALRMLPGSEAPIVRGDADRLRQVVDNLIGNGLQHGSGTVTVAVGTRGGQAVVEVSDEGHGVDPDEAARVFDRFYRSAGDRSRATGGSGLGLSIVAAIVAAHGGTVSVIGATFTVVIPLAG